MPASADHLTTTQTMTTEPWKPTSHREKDPRIQMFQSKKRTEKIFRINLASDTYEMDILKATYTHVICNFM